MEGNQSQLSILKSIICCILALICGTAIHKYFKLPVKDLFSFILYPSLFYLFMKVGFKFEKRLGIISLITTGILVFTQIYGGWINWLFTQDVIPTEIKLCFDIMLISIGLFIPIYLFIYKILDMCQFITIDSIKVKCSRKKKIFLVSFSVILLCWIPLYYSLSRNYYA